MFNEHDSLFARQNKTQRLDVGDGRIYLWIQRIMCVKYSECERAMIVASSYAIILWLWFNKLL